MSKFLKITSYVLVGLSFIMFCINLWDNQLLDAFGFALFTAGMAFTSFLADKATNAFSELHMYRKLLDIYRTFIDDICEITDTGAAAVIFDDEDGHWTMKSIPIPPQFISELTPESTSTSSAPADPTPEPPADPTPEPPADPAPEPMVNEAARAAIAQRRSTLDNLSN